MFNKNNMLLKSNSYSIDNLNTYILQGICVVDDLLLITAYDSKKMLNSKIYIIKDNEVINEIILDINSHVGGICYDNENKIIWITNKNGCINGYKKGDLLNNKVKPIFKEIKLGNDFYSIYNNISIAYISYHNNRIYVGNYNKNDKAIMKSFGILKNGNIDLNNVITHKFIDYVQGLTFYNDLIFISSSYGPFSSSKIYYLNYDKNIEDYNKVSKNMLKMPRMIEQITIKDNTLYTVYESNAKKYKYYGFRSDDIIEYNLNLEGDINEK